MTNIPTLDKILNMQFSDVSEFSPQTLNILMDELAKFKTKYETASAFMQTVLNYKYNFDPAYAAKGENTGTANINDNGHKITMNRPKRVTWNQKALAEVEKTLASSWDADPAEYIDTTRKVSETKYNSWPTPIRKVFDNARTVSIGKATIKIERVE